MTVSKAISAAAAIISFQAEGIFADTAKGCPGFKGDEVEYNVIADRDIDGTFKGSIPIQYDPAFIFQPSPSADSEYGNLGILFELDYLSPTKRVVHLGQGSRPRPSEDTFITIFLESKNSVVELDQLLSILAFARVGEPYHVSARYRGEFSTVEFKNSSDSSFPAGMWRNFYISQSADGSTSGVLACSSEANSPNPTCRLDFDRGPFRVSIGAIRREELTRLPLIKDLSSEFVRCLTAD